MRILVTGGAGFIGSHLCEQLIKENHTVAVVDNFDDFYSPAIKRLNIKLLSTSKDFLLFEGDIRDADFLDSVFSKIKPELVFHLAARAGVRPSIVQPALYFDVNLNGTLCLLETMTSYDVRKLIFASSSSVYGNNQKTPFSESDNVDFPISPYAASKKAGELLCHTWHHLHGFDIFCMRFFTVYGPRQRPEMAIARFIRAITDGQAIEVFGDGTSRRDYTYIDDIIAGLIAAIPKLKGYEIINLGESQTTSLSELINLIGKQIKRDAILMHKPVQPGDVENTYADISKARRLLGYNPSTGIEAGIVRYIDWYNSANKPS
jgi:UDP-glucuronate 4-epimerase